MKVLFWDRKNNRRVWNTELMPINFCETRVCEQDDQYFSKEYCLANIGYKSIPHKKYRNWDLFTTVNDLIFLGFDDETQPTKG
jgi:hypothetical protein